MVKAKIKPLSSFPHELLASAIKQQGRERAGEQRLPVIDEFPLPGTAMRSPELCPPPLCSHPLQSSSPQPSLCFPSSSVALMNVSFAACFGSSLAFLSSRGRMVKRLAFRGQNLGQSQTCPAISSPETETWASAVE